MVEQELIAVVGLAGRWPMSPDVDALWRNLLDGRECVHELDDETLLARGETAARLRHPSYVRMRPLLDGFDEFDARYFGMTPKEAEVRDPQHRLFLETCHTLLEHAGHDPRRYEGSIGLFAGVNGSRYGDIYLRASAEYVRSIGEMAIETGTHVDYVSTFASYKLGLRGPTLTVATACSTSLVAIHLACQALRTGGCEMAIAGGVEIEWPYGMGYVYSPGGIYPPDGHTRPFDAAGAGTVFGSGVGAVLLKRYGDAVADRDTVYALIRGSAINNDGSEKVGFTAPSVIGQSACVAEALTSAGVDPETISYVEAHGTATKLGDPIEVRALTQAHRLVGGGTATGYCGIGSIKSNLGHLGPAAGVTGFAKAVLALHHERIPATINFTEPNPELRLEETPFRVVSAQAEWPRVEGRPRRAGVSSFGIGGTNAHVVLEEAPTPPAREADGDRPHLLLWSARTPAAASELRDRLAAHVAWTGADLRDVAHTLRVGRQEHPVRAAVVTTTAAAAEALQAVEPGQPAAAGAAEAVVFAFPGQGAQSVRMAHGLYELDPTFRQGLDACLEVLADATGSDLRALWLAAPADRLAETAVAQPLLYAVEYVMASVLSSIAGRPAAVVGHSLGEVVAGAVAGVFSFEDGLRVVAERGRLMQEMPRGSMLAVPAALDNVRRALPDGVAIAAVNGRRQVVVSGAAEAIEEAERALREAGLRPALLRTSHAYHSPLMADAAERFRAFLATVPMAEPRVPLLSAATASFPGAAAATPDFWADQLVTPVRFSDAAAALFEARPGCTVLEVGPGNTLTGLLRGHAGSRGSGATIRPVIGHVEPGPGEYTAYLATLGFLWTAGRRMDWSAFDALGGRRVPLPTYPFARRRHFVDRPTEAELLAAAPAVEPPAEPATTAAAAPAPEAEPAPAPASATSAPDRPLLAEVTWARHGPAPEAAPGDDPIAPALTIMPADPAAGARLMAALQRAGLDPLPLGADPRDRDAVLGAVERLARAGTLPATVVHAGLFDPSDAGEPVADALSLVWLAQAMQRFRAEAGLRAWRLLVLTQRGADVTGGEPVVPGRWMLTGLLRTLALEVPSVACHLVDAGPRTPAAALVAQVRAPRWPVVALRGRDAWIPALRPLEGEPARRSRLRRRGVYAITGGLGALGLVTARALASTGLEPRLVLAGRSGLPAGEAGAAVREALADLEARGAEVEVVAADVATEEGARRLLDRARERFGAINGLIHAAGVAGDGLIELRTREQLEGVLRPKVVAGAILHRLLAEEPALDLVVHYSSAAAVSGLVGSADYAAANAYLDALARAEAGGDVHVVSVNWPAWDEVGMAARGGSPSPSANGHVPEERPPDGELAVERVLTGQEWFLDEHRIAGEPVLPGTAYVDLLLAAARQAGIVPDGVAAMLRDLVITAPLVIAGPTTVRVQLRPADRLHMVALRSRPAGAGAWTDHAQAVLSATDEEPADLDLTEVYARMDGGERFDGNAQSGLVAFGPRWLNVARAAREGDTFLSELRLPEAYRAEPAEHQAHPALLDNATAVIQHGATRPHLPFLYREAVFFRPLPDAVISIATVRGGQADAITADIDLHDLRGRHLARIKGFTMRAVDPGSFGRSVAKRAPAAAPEPLARDGRWLSPAEGAAVLLRLIERDGPANVLVRAPGTTLEMPGHVLLVPGAPAAAAPPPPVPPATVAAPSPSPAAASAPAAAPAPAAGAGSAEQRLHGLFVEVLGDEAIGPDDDFFAAGGSSLSAVQLVARIRDTFGIELSVGILFEQGTIRHLAGELARLA